MVSPEPLLSWILRQGADAVLCTYTDLGAWWRAFREARQQWSASIDQAVAGGLQADRVGYAFAAGYQSALRCLVPSLPAERLASLSVTEEGGGHPRAIASTLKPERPGAATGGWTLSGRKKWATLSCDGDLALVAASVGFDDDGRNQLRLVRVALDSPGVTVRPMPPTPFTPEIAHGALEFENVSVAGDAMLPGDGYARYIRPFRTVEDTHVSAAILGHLIALAIRFEWPRAVREDLLNLVVNLRPIAMADPSAPEVHVALGGFFTAYATVLGRLGRCWEHIPREMQERWERDSSIVSIAGSLRGKRLTAAWERIDQSRSIR